MKDCPRCGFLNPDRAEYCIKCRFLWGEGAPQRVPPGTEPEVGHGPMPDDGPHGFGAGPAEPPLDDKPDILAPTPDLDDTFAGRGMDVGGYGIGGTVSDHSASTPAPGDAFALMTGGHALTPGERPIPGRKRRGRAKSGSPKKLERELSRSLGAAAQPAPRREPSPRARPAPAPRPARPKTGPSHPARAGTVRAARTPARPAIQRPKVEVLSRVGEIATPRNVFTAIVGLMALLAFIYLFAGGSFFARAEQGALDKASGTMSSLGSVHVSAALTIDSEKWGATGGSAVFDLTKSGEFIGTYTVNGPGGPETTQVSLAGGKWYTTGSSGGWTQTKEPFVSPEALSGGTFQGASGATILGQEAIGDVLCTRVSFSGGPRMAQSLFPSTDTSDATRVAGEVWIDAQGLIRHMRLTGTDLESRNLGTFSFTAEIGYTDFNAQKQINPPS